MNIPSLAVGMVAIGGFVGAMYLAPDAFTAAVVLMVHAWFLAIWIKD